jgi:hypothetical protein
MLGLHWRAIHVSLIILSFFLQSCELVGKSYSSIGRFHHFRSFFNNQSHQSIRSRQFFPFHVNLKTGWCTGRCVSSRQTIFIDLSIWISFWKLHHHAPCGSDVLPSQKDVFQAEGLDLLPVFRCRYVVKLEQQEQVVCQHHQLAWSFMLGMN